MTRLGVDPYVWQNVHDMARVTDRQIESNVDGNAWRHVRLILRTMRPAVDALLSIDTTGAQ